MKQSKNQKKWNQILSNWETSGQSQSVFCKEHSLSLASFGYYRTRQIRIQKQSDQPIRTNQFIETRIENPVQKPSVFSLEIQGNGSIKLQLNLPGLF